MTDPQDRPPASDRPAPYEDPPDQQAAPPAPGGPPGDPAGEPNARWEDVVDPQLEPEPPPPPAPPAPPAAEDDWPEPNRVRTAPAPAAGGGRQAAAARAAVAEVDDDEYDDADEYLDDPASRWVSLLATIGTALIGIVTVQVLTSLVEGLTLQSSQRVGVPDDFFHRIGYPFGGLGATALVFLVLGVVLVSMPSVLDELLSEAQDRVVGIALVVAIVMAVIIAVGSLLAVRANLHEYAAKNVPVPSYVRVQFTNFLLGALGAAALALFGSIAAMNERKRERFD